MNAQITLQEATRVTGYEGYTLEPTERKPVVVNSYNEAVAFVEAEGKTIRDFIVKVGDQEPTNSDTYSEFYFNQWLNRNGLVTFDEVLTEKGYKDARFVKGVGYVANHSGMTVTVRKCNMGLEASFSVNGTALASELGVPLTLCGNRVTIAEYLFKASYQIVLLKLSKYFN